MTKIFEILNQTFTEKKNKCKSLMYQIQYFYSKLTLWLNPNYSPHIHHHCSLYQNAHCSGHQFFWWGGTGLQGGSVEVKIGGVPPIVHNPALILLFLPHNCVFSLPSISMTKSSSESPLFVVKNASFLFFTSH